MSDLLAVAARLRSQLAEAREAKDWLAKNVDEALAAIHAAPQEIAPLATPFAPGDLPRAVAALIERAVRILRERDSLREERDRLVAEVRRVADEWDAQTDHVDWDAVNVVERFVADVRSLLSPTPDTPAQEGSAK